jgi:hypothetical protein
MAHILLSGTPGDSVLQLSFLLLLLLFSEVFASALPNTEATEAMRKCFSGATVRQEGRPVEDRGCMCREYGLQQLLL